MPSIDLGSLLLQALELYLSSRLALLKSRLCDTSGEHSEGLPSFLSSLAALIQDTITQVHASMRVCGRGGCFPAVSGDFRAGFVLKTHCWYSWPLHEIVK